MPTLRNIIIFVSIAAIIFFAYFYFFKPEPEEEALVTTSSAPSSDAAQPEAQGTTDPTMAQNFITLLLSVRNIKLESAVLANPIFKSLKDSSIELISDGTEGRVNPFANLGSDAPPPQPEPQVELPLEEFSPLDSNPTDEPPADESAQNDALPE